MIIKVITRQVGKRSAYEQAKALLFAWPDLKHRIINGDDAAGRRLIAQWAPAVIRYGFTADDLYLSRTLMQFKRQARRL